MICLFSLFVILQTAFADEKSTIFTPFYIYYEVKRRLL